MSFQIKLAGFSFVTAVTFLTAVTLVFFPPIMPSEIAARILQQSGLIKMFVIMAVALLMIFIILPALLRRSLTQPLSQLLEAVKMVNQGNLQVQVPELYRDEIGLLTRLLIR